MFNYFKNRRRRRAIQESLSEEQSKFIQKNFDFYAKLSLNQQQRLRDLICIFLLEKKFIACGGLKMTDEVKLTIAAFACFLHLGFPHDHLYPYLHSIYVYPHAYRTKVRRLVAGNFVLEGEEVRLGESWHKAFVVLAWDQIKMEVQSIHEGHNVVLHEFAHQLDQESGQMNGTPDLEESARFAVWGRVLSPLFLHLRDEVRKHHPTLVDRYGSTNEAEFFAVLTETFFGKPRQLKKTYPEAYRLLQEFYGQDPILYC